MARMHVALGVLVLLAVPAGAPLMPSAPSPAASEAVAPQPTATLAAPATIPAAAEEPAAPQDPVEVCETGLMVTLRRWVSFPVETRVDDLAGVSLGQDMAEVSVLDQAVPASMPGEAQAAAAVDGLLGVAVDVLQPTLDEVPVAGEQPTPSMADAVQSVDGLSLEARLVVDMVRYEAIPIDETLLVSPNAILPPLPGMRISLTEVCDGTPLLDGIPFLASLALGLDEPRQGWYAGIPRLVVSA